MIFKVMGRKYELHYAIRTLGINFETMSAKSIFNIMLDKCCYKDNEEMGIIDGIYKEKYPTNEYIEICKINSNVKMDELIIDGIKYDNLRYVYNCNERESYIYIEELIRVQYPPEKIKIIAMNTFNELNNLIKQRDSKIKGAAGNGN